MGYRPICQPCQHGVLQECKAQLEQLRSALSGVAVYHDQINQTELYNKLKNDRHNHHTRYDRTITIHLV